MTRYFPLMTRLENETVLIIGGGRLAEERAAQLLQYAPRLVLLADEVCAPLLRRVEAGELVRDGVPLCHAEEALGRWRPILVILADLELPICERLAAACRQRGIAVNAVDRPALCTVIFPSILRRGRLTVAVSTDGASPTAARCLRERIGESIPQRSEEILDWLAELRPHLRERTGGDRAALSRVLRALTEAAFSEDRPLPADETEALICLSLGKNE